MEPAKHRRALVVDDHPMVAESVAAVIRSRDAGAVVEVAHSLKSTLHLKDKGRDFDLIVLDLSLPDSKGPSTFEAVHNAWPDVSTIIFSGVNHNLLISQCINQGAKAFIPKSDDVKSLYGALEELWPIDQGIGPALAPGAFSADLTNKQMAIWQDIAAGYANQEIADRHRIGINTVKSHVREILERIQVRNRTEAAKLYFDYQKAGLIQQNI